MCNRPILTIPVQKVEGDSCAPFQDLLAVEEPFEIRLGDKSISITVPTPEHDFEMAAGFLFSEGILGLRTDRRPALGAEMLAGHMRLGDRLMFVSSRASFELVQKAPMAGIPILAAVGAPSSLAVKTAQRSNLTLLGFVRDTRFNIYSGASRIQ